jgi:hypothetical protein
MAYGIPNKRPVQLAPNMGTTPSYASAPSAPRRVKMQTGRPRGPVGGLGASRRRPPGAPGPIPGQRAPQQMLRDPFHTTPLADEIEGLVAGMGMARFPGVGQPGSERGMTNVRRRRLG